MILDHSTNGRLNLKETYKHVCHSNQPLPLFKRIWYPQIPPSASSLIWRIIHNKLPSQGALRNKGFFIVSMCSLCGSSYETSDHLIYQFPFVVGLWNWLGGISYCHIYTSSILSILSSGKTSGSAQVVDIFLAVEIFTIWVIWYSRNQICFCNQIITVQQATSIVSSKVNITSNSTKAVMGPSVSELLILKHLGINGHPRKFIRIKEVIWRPPKSGWIIYNSDGSAHGYPVMGAIRAIELADRFGWSNLWLESDSALVVQSFAGVSLMHCSLRNRWLNCTAVTKSFCFVVGHIYREGNVCADTLASKATSMAGFCWWKSTPSFLVAELNRNRIGLT
ncbi:hypothetical protein D0Y65_030385 [Glycine soja]|nr:hypothetical protein D0Y65_030385 [Glycine soja]